MANEDETVTINSLLGGELVQRIDEAIQDVLNDIADPNTPAKSKREVVMRLGFISDGERQVVVADCHVIKKLGEQQMPMAKLLLGISGGRVCAVEMSSRQTDLEEYVDGKVVDIKERKNA